MYCRVCNTELGSNNRSGLCGVHYELEAKKVAEQSRKQCENGCGRLVAANSKSGLCRQCAHKGPRLPGSKGVDDSWF